MATTDVEICNLALLINGQMTISSLTESTTEATYCNQVYDMCRKYLLKKFKPKFATKTSELSEDAVLESDKWDYVYDMPSDALLIMELQPEDGFVEKSVEIEWEIVGTHIYTNEEDPWCQYIYDCEDETIFDDMFANTLSHYIAFYIAQPIHRDAGWTKLLFDIFRAKLSEGMAEDANEGHDLIKFGQTFITARN